MLQRAFKIIIAILSFIFIPYYLGKLVVEKSSDIAFIYANGIGIIIGLMIVGIVLYYIIYIYI